MKKTLSLLFLLLLAGESFAQIKVEKFSLLKQDNTAIMTAPVKNPKDGKKCALIKVVTAVEDFYFDIGMVNIVEIVNHPEQGEVWLYVPDGTQKLKIAHPKLGQIESSDGFYWFPRANKPASGKTYRMVISHNPLPEAPKLGRVTFHCNVDGAEVTLLGERPIAVGHTAGGTLSTAYTLGELNYRVSKAGYADHDGAIEVDSLTDVQVSLTPLRCMLSVSSLPGATLLVNGRDMGEGEAEFDLPAGTYTITARLDGHTDASQELTLAAGTERSITLQPRRITGFLSVETRPAGSDIFVDGRHMGTTPALLSGLEPGSHDVLLARPSSYYLDRREVVAVSGNDTARLSRRFSRRSLLALSLGAQFPSTTMLTAGANLYFREAAGLTVELGGFFALAPGQAAWGETLSSPVGIYEQVGFSFHPRDNIRLTPLVEMNLYNLNGSHLSHNLGLGFKGTFALNPAMQLFFLPKLSYVGRYSDGYTGQPSRGRLFFNLQAGVLLF